MMLNGNGEASELQQHPLADVYLKLMRDSQLWTAPLDEALRKILVVVNDALKTRRTWLWSFSPTLDRLTLMMGYDGIDRSFNHGAEISCADYPEHFRRYETVHVEAVSDIQQHPGFREFIVRGLIGPDIKAILNSTVHVASKSWGILSVSEYDAIRIWSASESWFIASIADLIAQLITYAELRRNEHWLSFVADNLPIAILKFDLNGHCDYANPHWEHLTRSDAKAAYGDGWQRFVHVDDRAVMLDKLNMVGVSGERSEAELRLLRNHQNVWVACAWVSERDIDGMPIAVFGTFVDVTHERILRENEQRYRLLFNNVNDAVLLGRGRYAIDCNARTLDMFACTREQIIGETTGRFSPEFQPDGRPSTDFAHIIAVAEKGEQQFFEWQYQRADGTLFDAEVTLSFITFNEEPHLLATVHDISERKAIEAALRISNERLSRINRIAARIYGLRDIESVACASVEVLSEQEAVPLVRFFVFDAATRVVRMIAERDGHGHIHLASGPFHQRILDDFSDPDIGIVTDIDTLPTSEKKREMMRDRGTQSIVYLWLRGEEERIGMITLEYRDVIEFSDDLRADLLAIGKAVSMALSNVLFIARMEYQATHDSLTGLANRSLLQRELETLSVDQAHISGLMLLDLDRFKEVNDTLGHLVGDRLLIALAQRFANAMKERNVLLCRPGGDEFAILLRETTLPELHQTADTLLDLLRQPFAVDDVVLEIGGSIGAASFPQQGESGSALLRLADVAMYEAKRNGSGYVYYDRQFDSYTPERLALMQELRAAIIHDQLVLHYQPRLNLATGEIAGFEALVRWQHPQRGLLLPGVFLPLAEMSDVIHALTLAVLEQALLQLRKWSQRGLRYSIAVNLSARNLINEQCFVRLREMIDQYEADPGLLELEITETALMHDPMGAAKLIEGLARLGIKFSIDDFGTGYSSLAYLRQLPIQALKIDRTFVMDMVRNEQDATIVKSTIALAHNLKLVVIAEGVENGEALKMLREMGCDEAQGYFISRPEPAAVIERWLEDAAWPRA